MSSNNGVSIQHEADNRKYFATNNNNELLNSVLLKTTLDATFTRLTSSGIIIDLDTWVGSLGNNKTTLYNSIKDLNWGVGNPRTSSGNNTSFGINNNVQLGGRYKISDYLTESQFTSTTNLKLFYNSSNEIGIIHGTLVNIGVANYGTDRTKHSVNNLRQGTSTVLWGTLNNGYLFLNDTFGKVIYFDNNGLGFLNKSLVSNYGGRWIPFLDGGNYTGNGLNRIVWGDNTWNSETSNTVKGSINGFISFPNLNYSPYLHPTTNLNHFKAINTYYFSASGFHSSNNFILTVIENDFDYGFRLGHSSGNYKGAFTAVPGGRLDYLFFPLY